MCCSCDTSLKLSLHTSVMTNHVTCLFPKVSSFVFFWVVVSVIVQWIASKDSSLKWPNYMLSGSLNCLLTHICIIIVIIEEKFPDVGNMLLGSWMLLANCRLIAVKLRSRQCEAFCCNVFTFFSLLNGAKHSDSCLYAGLQIVLVGG